MTGECPARSALGAQAPADALHCCRYCRRCKRLQLCPGWLRLPSTEARTTPAELREQKITIFKASKQLRSTLQAHEASLQRGSDADEAANG